MSAPQKARFEDMEPAQQAGILCNDPRFQRFAAMRCGLPDTQFSATGAAQYLRDCCKTESRRTLNRRGNDFLRFERLKTEFDAWTGRIPPQR